MFRGVRAKNREQECERERDCKAATNDAHIFETAFKIQREKAIRQCTESQCIRDKEIGKAERVDQSNVKSPPINSPHFIDIASRIANPRYTFRQALRACTLQLRTTYQQLKQKLIAQLMRSYRRYERPTEGSHEPTRVYISIKILAVTSVDVINMQYTADMILIQRWKDPRLRWNHLPEYAFITRDLLLTHKRNDIWLPDLFFRNGKEGLLYKMTVPNHKILVSPDGRIYFSQKITMRLACEMHLRNFPMDQQDCDMDIGSYGYTLDQLKFIWDGNNTLKFADDMVISEFNTPVTAITEDCTNPQTTSTGTYTCLLARFQLKRQIGSYLLGFYIPAFLIVVVSWLTFWVRPEAIPARVTLGLLTLISLLTKASKDVPDIQLINE
ncbi:hypothetical protein Aperf_G00000112105 [Anoplocephala perfoliata]